MPRLITWEKRLLHRCREQADLLVCVLCPMSAPSCLPCWGPRRPEPGCGFPISTVSSWRCFGHRPHTSSRCTVSSVFLDLILLLMAGSEKQPVLGNSGPEQCRTESQNSGSPLLGPERRQASVSSVHPWAYVDLTESLWEPPEHVPTTDHTPGRQLQTEPAAPLK